MRGTKVGADLPMLCAAFFFFTRASFQHFPLQTNIQTSLLVRDSNMGTSMNFALTFFICNDTDPAHRKKLNSFNMRTIENFRKKKENLGSKK